MMMMMVVVAAPAAAAAAAAAAAVRRDHAINKCLANVEPLYVNSAPFASLDHRTDFRKRVWQMNN
jgi:hypothetical protein